MLFPKLQAILPWETWQMSNSYMSPVKCSKKTKGRPEPGHCPCPFLLLTLDHREVPQQTTFLQQFWNSPAKPLMENFQAELLYLYKWLDSFKKNNPKKQSNFSAFAETWRQKCEWAVGFPFCNPKSFIIINFLTTVRAGTETQQQAFLKQQHSCKFYFYSALGAFQPHFPKV